MVDKDGHIITNSDDIKQATLDHCKTVLANRTIILELEDHQYEREKLCEERLKDASKKVTPNWSHTYVENVVNNLKKK